MKLLTNKQYDKIVSIHREAINDRNLARYQLDDMTSALFELAMNNSVANREWFSLGAEEMLLNIKEQLE